jgi:hypothetical protein
MQTVHCELHGKVILIFEPSDEYLFAPNIEATIIYYDDQGKAYLKKFTLGQCDDSCPTVQDWLNGVTGTNLIN